MGTGAVWDTTAEFSRDVTFWNVTQSNTAKGMTKRTLYIRCNYSAGEKYWERALKFEFLGKIAARFSAKICRNS